MKRLRDQMTTPINDTYRQVLQQYWRREVDIFMTRFHHWGTWPNQRIVEHIVISLE